MAVALWCQALYHPRPSVALACLPYFRMQPICAAVQRTGTKCRAGRGGARASPGRLSSSKAAAGSAGDIKAGRIPGDN